MNYYNSQIILFRRRFGYSRVRIKAMAEDYKSGKIDRVLPRLGGRKLQVMLYQRGHDVGRDRLFDLLREAGMLVSRERFRARTNDFRHWMRKWDNLIRDVVPVCYS